MLKHRLSKFSYSMLVALCTLVTCGLTTSCEDDYIYDDSEPKWLGASIYHFLSKETGDHTYQNYVRIIEDLDQKDVLGRTGSKTLFVADDNAFEKFFANNKWGVTRYEDLSLAQKKVILYNSMLDNAYLLDMMSSTSGTPPQEGSCLRRATSAEVVDTVPFFNEADIPANNKRWDRFRAVNGGTGLRIAIDGSRPMMIHFLHEYLTTNNITDTDFSVIFNNRKSRSGTEAFIFGNKVLSSGIKYDSYSDDTLTITCKNGYVYRMDSVLVPPSNMAQELRDHPKTKLFSRMLDRFSAPLPSPRITEEYNRLYHYGDEANAEKVYDLRYFNSSTAHLLSSYLDDDKVSQTLAASLSYDPGWNQYKTSNLTSEQDMASMFVPNDEKIKEYFSDGGEGFFLVERYGNPTWPIEQSLDSIPLDIIHAFIANLMKTSFVSSVPSKFDKVTNDARDPMGLEIHHVDEGVIANNGVIYILNTVFGPAKYQSVSAPPLVLQNMRVMRRIIDDLGYDSYLLAMDSYFSFIIPDDKYFVYYDPATLEKDYREMYTFHYGRSKPTDTKDVVWAKRSKYDPVTYQELDSIGVISAEKISGNPVMENRMRDLMEYLIIVNNIESGNQYYLSKGYGTVKCKVTSKTAEGIKFYGGEQVENGREVSVLARYTEKNGISYCTYSEDPSNPSGIPSPPTVSVYSKMNENIEFSKFHEACNGIDAELLLKIFPNANPVKVGVDSLKKYSVFYRATTGNKNGRNFNVPFFSTYHYSIYVPTNNAMQQAYDMGFPTWEQLDEYAKNAEFGRAASYIRMMNKFFRYHFQDNAVYVDKLPFSITSAGVTSDTVRYETAAIDDYTGRFYELVIKTLGSTYGNTISVRDQKGRTHYVQNQPGQEGKLWNIMARDLEFNTRDPKAATAISTSSFAVMHQIDGLLLNDGVLGFDGRFRRFAEDGELVDTMKVSGVANKYLVGFRNNVLYETAQGDRYKRTGYLMKTAAQYQEKYVLNAREEKILITNDGYLIDETGKYINTEGNVINVEAGGLPVKVDNNGNVI